MNLTTSIEKNVESFIDELKVLSKYGSAGGTGIKLDFNAFLN